MGEGAGKLSLERRVLQASVREPLRAHLATRARVSREGAGTASAVLVPLFASPGDDDVQLWLLKRATAMRKHSGQVAFPGGKRDPVDVDLVATALREAEEEIGLPPAGVDVLGALDDHVTSTGYVITPIVAWVPADLVPRPNPSEVARVFPARLSRFLREGDARAFFEQRIGYSIDGEFVWGATATIATRLGAIVKELGRHR